MVHRTARYNPRWLVAERVSEAVRRRYGPQISSIGVHGALAHEDVDDGGSEADLIVVTRRTGTGPDAARRRVEGIIVGLTVVSTEEALAQARTLTPDWPLLADRYLNTKLLHDPDRFLHRLRDAHLGRLARAGGGELAGLAREAWYDARAAHNRARRLAEADESEAGHYSLGQARLSAALVEGLLARTYFRDSADAIRQTGFGVIDVVALDDRLHIQAQELARRGRPVDGDVDDLLT